MKKRFVVMMEEIIADDFEVIAENEEKAIEIAKEKYKSGEFVLSPGILISKQMAVKDTTDGEVTDWFEF